MGAMLETVARLTSRCVARPDRAEAGIASQVRGRRLLAALALALALGCVGAGGPEVARYTERVPNLRLPSFFSGSSARLAQGLQIRATAQRFAIYYGWPSAVNGAGDLDEAARVFSQFAIIVLGDGLHQAGHPDNEPTAAIIARLRATGTTTVFGYVDLGVSTQNLPLETIISSSEAWRRIGAAGIFLDDAGEDFGVSVARRDAAVEGVRQLGLRVILNAHDPEDAFRGRARLRPGDGYLFESFQVADGRIQPAAQVFAKADRALELALDAGVDVYAVASGPADDPGLRSKLDYAWWSTVLYSFAYFQYTTIDYGARSGRLEGHGRDEVDVGNRYLEQAVRHIWAEGLHTRQTDGGEIRLSTGPEPRGSFVPRPIP